MKRRNPSAVSKRAIVMNCVVAASFGVPRETIVAWLKSEEIWDIATEWESRYLLTEVPSEEDDIEANQTAEAVATLDWALGLLESLPDAAQPTPLDQVVDSLPQINEPTAEFLSSAKLRPQNEISEFNESIYNLQWAVRDALLNDRPIPDDSHPVVVFQRHRASNWLCPDVVGDVEWHEVHTDT